MGRAGWTALLAICALWSPSPSAAAPDDDGASTADVLAVVDSLWSAGGRDSSQAVIEAHLPRARAEADSALLRGLLQRYGAHLVSFGDNPRAEVVLREAIALAEAQADSASLLNSVRWLSVAVGGQGRADEAHDLYVRLQDLARRRGDLRQEAWALIGFAWESGQAGRRRESADFSRRAAELFNRTGDVQGEIWARNSLGVALSAMGDYRGAAECYRRSADAARAVDFAMVEAMALNNLGSLEYGLGDPGQAIEAFRRALDIMRRIDQKREAVTPELNIAVSLMDLGRLDDAGDVLARCVEECAANNYLDLQGIALYQEAELRRRRALAHEAAGLYRRALALGPAQTLRNRIECLVGLSDALAEIDSAGAAFDAARAAVDIVVREGAREMEPLARRTLARRWTAAGEHRKSLAELTAADRAAALSGWSDRRVGILADAAGNWRALGEPDRALALLDSAAAIWEEERRIPLDPEWRESRGASGKIIFTDLADLLLGPDPASASGERIAAAFNRLQRFKTRTLIERMLGPGGLDSCSAVPEPGRTITLTQLQNELLGDGDLFLDFHLGPNRSILFAVTRDEARCIRLPSATTLEPRLRIYKEILTSGMESGGERSRLPEVARDAVAREVSSLLFGGIEDLLGVSRRVLLSPDGALNLLPLSDLPGRDGALLIEGREWIRVPSAEVLRRIAERPATGLANREIRTLALVGAGRLPGAEREVAELHRGFRGVRTELDASGLSSSEVLHFASHLEVDDQHPWQSSLRLDAGDSTLALDAGTLARMKLPARLAVLSGCSSAGGRIVSGEGVLGISSALLSAGVPSVVATLWPVDDGVTAGFMREFYRRLSEGAPAARALEAAQAELRSRPATREPRHWAGFVLIGDGDVRVPLHRRNAASRPVGLGLVAAGALLALASLRARPRRPR